MSTRPGQSRKRSEEQILAIELAENFLLVRHDTSSKSAIPLKIFGAPIPYEKGRGEIIRLGPDCHESLKVGDEIEFDTWVAVKFNTEKADYVVISDRCIMNKVGEHNGLFPIIDA